MNKYMNKFFCMIAATVASYAVNIVYNLHSAFAVVWETGTTCAPGSTTSWHTTYVHDNCSDMVHSTCSVWRWYTTGITQSKAAYLIAAGWQLVGCSGDNPTGSAYGSGYGSARASCSYQSYERRPYQPKVDFRSLGCGSYKYCDDRLDEFHCNTAGNAGYISGLTGCNCCPGAMLGDGSYNVYADYDAMAAADCYIVGTIKDETGLFQYTDDNRCYYAS